LTEKDMPTIGWWYARLHLTSIILIISVQELTKTTIEEKEEGELDLCLSTAFNKGRA